MYYYNEQECILNAETRSSKPDLFIPEGDEFQVCSNSFKAPSKQKAGMDL